MLSAGLRDSESRHESLHEAFVLLCGRGEPGVEEVRRWLRGTARELADGLGERLLVRGLPDREERGVRLPVV